MEQKPQEHAADVVSREEYEQLKSRNAELEQQVNALTEALRLAQHKRFGASSEKTVDDGSQQLSFLFNEAEAIADHEAAQDEKETVVAAHKRHKKHEYTHRPSLGTRPSAGYARRLQAIAVASQAYA